MPGNKTDEQISEHKLQFSLQFLVRQNRGVRSYFLNRLKCRFYSTEIIDFPFLVSFFFAFIFTDS